MKRGDYTILSLPFAGQRIYKYHFSKRKKKIFKPRQNNIDAVKFKQHKLINKYQI